MKKLIFACTALVLFAKVANAHAVVFPATSHTGAYEKYTLRVPNEKNVPTTRIEIDFPQSVRVISFSDVQGWTLEVVTDSAQRITAAVWTGTLQPHRFVELPFIAVNPKAAETLTWPVHQNYGDEQVDWVGPAASKLPASVTVIENPQSSAGESTLWVSVIAVLLSLAALGVALRRN
jgi:uncharacterized protein YcnI